MIEDMLMTKKKTAPLYNTTGREFEIALATIDENFDLLDGEHVVIET
jgi:hypothetical protein